MITLIMIMRIIFILIAVVIIIIILSVALPLALVLAWAIAVPPDDELPQSAVHLASLFRDRLDAVASQLRLGLRVEHIAAHLLHR